MRRESMNEGLNRSSLENSFPSIVGLVQEDIFAGMDFVLRGGGELGRMGRWSMCPHKASCS